MNKNIMNSVGFSEQVKLFESSKCVFCKKEINVNKEFIDKLSLKEYKISGMCQSCQDQIFGG